MSVFHRTVAVVLLAAAAGGCTFRQTARAHFDAANEYAAKGRLREAVIEYRRVLQLEPRHAPARVKLAETYERLDDQSNAYREYVRAADLLPGADAVQIKAGHFLLLAGRFEDANARATAVLSRHDSIDARILRARALAGLKQVDAALEELWKAGSVDPRRGDAYIDIGYLEYGRGRADEAEAAFKAAVQAEPQAVAPRLALADFLFGEQRTHDAEETLRLALQIDPRDVRVNRAVATFFLRTSRAAQAEPYLKAAAQIDGSAASKLAVADYYVVTGRYAEAEAALVPLAHDAATKVQAGIRLAGLRFVQQRRDEAYGAIEEVLRAQPHHSAALLARGSFRLVDGRLAEGVADLEAAVAADPQGVAARLILASAHAANRDIGAAIQDYTQILNLQPHATIAEYELSRLHLAAGDPARALDYARQAAAAAADRFDVRLLLARSLLANLDTDGAEVELRTLLRERPDSGAARAAMGTLLASRGEPSAARTWFNRALAVEPANVESTWGLAAIDVQAHRPEAARARVEGRVAMTPRDANVRLVAGVALVRAGDLAGAEMQLRGAIEADPQLVEAYARLAQLYVREDRLDDAEAELHAALERRPAAVPLRTLLGVVLHVQGRTDEAAAAYARALDVDANAAVAANNLAWLYAERGTNLDVALQLAQTAKRRLPDESRVSDTLGWVYYKKGMVSEAVAALRDAVDRNPEDAEAQYHRGVALLKNGDLEHAREALERALALDAHFAGAPDAREMLSRIGTD